MGEQTRRIEGETFHRTATIDSHAIDQDGRSVELSFSSEEPVDRYFGREILDHGPGSVRLGRLQQGGPLLLDHERGSLVGVVEKAWIGSDRKGRARVRFSRSARGDEAWRDVLDGIRRSASVAYRIHKAEREPGDDADVFRMVDWEPLEVSLVSVPADATVGVGRGLTEGKPMSDGIEVRDRDGRGEGGGSAAVERERVAELMAIGKHFGCQAEAERAIADGTTIEAFRRATLDRLAERQRPGAIAAGADLHDRGEIDMERSDLARYSFVRALRAVIAPTDRQVLREAGLELAVSEATAKKLHRAGEGLHVPLDVLRSPAVGQRTLSVGTATAGGALVATNVLADAFIDTLRARTTVLRLGAQTLGGLQGNAAIPRKSAASSASWIAEGADAPVSEPAFDTVALSPKTCALYVDLTRKLLLQSSPDIEALVRDDLATAIGEELDRVCLNGSGVDPEPQGVIGSTGVGSVSLATAGQPTWAEVLAMEAEAADANADVPGMAIVTTPAVRAWMKGTEKFSGSSGEPIWGGDNRVAGYVAEATSQVPANTVLLANFADLVIAQWGAVSLLSDPYSLSRSGGVRIVCMLDVDVGLRHPASFVVGA